MSADEVRRADEELSAAESRKAFSGLHAALTARILAVILRFITSWAGAFLRVYISAHLRLLLCRPGFGWLRKFAVPVYFRGELVGSFRAELVVNECVLLELEAVSMLDREHDGQLLHYLRATDHEVGLLLNFGPRPQFKRFILENGDKKIRVLPRESVVDPVRKLT